MKKLLFLFLMVCCSFELHAIELNGKYLSQSGELQFNFTTDSLYIGIAQSQRTVSKFKLVKKSDSAESTAFNAFESYIDNTGKATYREVLIRVSKEDGEKFLLEYFGKDKDRDYSSSERYHIRRAE